MSVMAVMAIEAVLNIAVLYENESEIIETVGDLTHLTLDIEYRCHHYISHIIMRAEHRTAQHLDVILWKT